MIERSLFDNRQVVEMPEPPSDETKMTRADHLLALLRRGPVSRPELIEFDHRFSASVNVLRDRGWHIEIADGVHSLIGYSPRVRVTETMKEAYYKTQHWKDKRRERMSHDCFQCVNCRSKRELQVHHWVYDLFDEDLADLHTYCAKCHKRIHKCKNVTVHFPKYVSEAVAKRLAARPA